MTDTTLPAGHCHPDCPGWFPSNIADARECIERCDECARVAGALDTYGDEDAERAAAAAVAAMMRRDHKGGLHHRLGAIVSALRQTESGREALHVAFWGRPQPHSTKIPTGTGGRRRYNHVIASPHLLDVDNEPCPHKDSEGFVWVGYSSGMGGGRFHLTPAESRAFGTQMIDAAAAYESAQGESR